MKSCKRGNTFALPLVSMILVRGIGMMEVWARENVIDMHLKLYYPLC